MDRRHTTRSNGTKMGEKGERGTLSDRPISYPVNVAQEKSDQPDSAPIPTHLKGGSKAMGPPFAQVD